MSFIHLFASLSAPLVALALGYLFGQRAHRTSVFNRWEEMDITTVFLIGADRGSWHVVTDHLPYKPEAVGTVIALLIEDCAENYEELYGGGRSDYARSILEAMNNELESQ